MRFLFLTFLLVLFFQDSGMMQAPAADLRVPLSPKRSPATSPPLCTIDGTGNASCSIMVPEKAPIAQKIGAPLQ